MIKVFFYKSPTLKAFYKKKCINQLLNSINASTILCTTTIIAECDIIISFEDYICELTEYYGNKKIVGYSVCDGISLCKNMYENKNVQLIIDHTVLSNTFDIVNDKIACLNSKRIDYVLDLANTQITYVDRNAYMTKAKCLFNLSSCFKRLYTPIVNPLKNRKYDIVFLGHLNYTPELTLLKTNIIKEILKMGEKYKLTVLAQESIPQNQYYKILSDCKIFVSSYGWGEFSTKEYDCICKGAHILKSKIYFESFPNFYKNMDDFELDLSNFEEKIFYILNNLNDAQLKVDLNRKLFREYKSETQYTLIEKTLMEL